MKSRHCRKPWQTARFKCSNNFEFLSEDYLSLRCPYFVTTRSNGTQDLALVAHTNKAAGDGGVVPFDRMHPRLPRCR